MNKLLDALILILGSIIVFGVLQFAYQIAMGVTLWVFR